MQAPLSSNISLISQKRWSVDLTTELVQFKARDYILGQSIVLCLQAAHMVGVMNLIPWGSKGEVSSSSCKQPTLRQVKDGYARLTQAVKGLDCCFINHPKLNNQTAKTNHSFSLQIYNLSKAWLRIYFYVTWYQLECPKTGMTWLLKIIWRLLMGSQVLSGRPVWFLHKTSWLPPDPRFQEGASQENRIKYLVF
jgi:hypothetical protein